KVAVVERVEPAGDLEAAREPDVTLRADPADSGFQLENRHDTVALKVEEALVAGEDVELGEAGAKVPDDEASRAGRGGHQPFAADHPGVEADSRPAAIKVDLARDDRGPGDLEGRFQVLIQVSIAAAGEHIHRIVAAVAANQVIVRAVAELEAHP